MAWLTATGKAYRSSQRPNLDISAVLLSERDDDDKGDDDDDGDISG